LRNPEVHQQRVWLGILQVHVVPIRRFFYSDFLYFLF
jgi:hypothetical protein